MKRTKLILVAAVAVSALAMSGASARSAPSVQSLTHQRIASAARAAHVDPQRVFSQKVTLKVWYPDGSTGAYRTTLGDVVDRWMPNQKAQTEPGPGGTPEVLAGNTTHLFAHVFAGSTSGADCGEYSITTSAASQTAGDTVGGATGVNPLIFVPVTAAPLFLTPIPGTLAPVIPESSWILPAYLAGGPIVHIKARYNTLGLHTVGTLIGSAASTAPGAPSPSPVWLPMVHTIGFVNDTNEDFVGQALAFYAPFRTDLFGFTLCGSVGGELLSDGIAIYDNHPILGLNVGLPDIP